MERPGIGLSNTVLGAPDASVLARFYQRLLGWDVRVDQGDWVILASGEGGPGLSFQSEPDYLPPTWPSAPGHQQMMMHLDIGVDDLAAGVAWAIHSGATLADVQPQVGVRVMIDPAGHPFCLFPHPPVSAD